MSQMTRLDDLELAYADGFIFLWEVPELWARRYPRATAIILIAIIGAAFL